MGNDNHMTKNTTMYNLFIVDESVIVPQEVVQEVETRNRMSVWTFEFVVQELKEYFYNNQYDDERYPHFRACDEIRQGPYFGDILYTFYD